MTRFIKGWFTESGRLNVVHLEVNGIKCIENLLVDIDLTKKSLTLTTLDDFVYKIDLNHIRSMCYPDCINREFSGVLVEVTKLVECGV